MTERAVHPAVEAWVRQLLDPDFTRVLDAAGPDGRIDVRLSAKGGKARSTPVITLNGGPAEWGDS